MPEYLLQYNDYNYVINALSREELNSKVAAKLDNNCVILQQFNTKFDQWVCIEDNILPEEGILKAGCPVRLVFAFNEYFYKICII